MIEEAQVKNVICLLLVMICVGIPAYLLGCHILPEFSRWQAGTVCSVNLGAEDVIINGEPACIDGALAVIEFRDKDGNHTSYKTNHDTKLVFGEENVYPVGLELRYGKVRRQNQSLTAVYRVRGNDLIIAKFTVDK